MYKILNRIANIPKDKILHFILCYILTDLILSILYTCYVSIFNSVYITLAFTTIVIFAKEFLDKYVQKTFFDWKDVLAGYIGVILKIVIYLLTVL